MVGRFVRACVRVETHAALLFLGHCYAVVTCSATSLPVVSWGDLGKQVTEDNGTV